VSGRKQTNDEQRQVSRRGYCSGAFLAHLQQSWLFALAQPANPGAVGQFGFYLLSCVRGMAVGKEDYLCLNIVAV